MREIFTTNRWRNHFLLAAITVFICALVRANTRQDLSVERVLIVGLGYVSLLLIALSLLIGPIYMIWKRRAPVNLNLRRDIGIWAGFTGLLHMLLALGLPLGARALRFFLIPGPDGGLTLLPGLFGLSNYSGGAAALLLALLLLLSNDISLRRLKGKPWKRLQRLNYLLFALALAHTVGYQLLGARVALLMWAVVIGALAVLTGQALGFRLYRARQRHA